MAVEARSVAWVGVVVLLAVGLVAVSAWAIRTTRWRTKQINDWIVVARVARQVESLRTRAGLLPTADEVARSVARSDLKDAWGNRLVYAVFTHDGREHYVVAALGRDGQVERPWQVWLSSSVRVSIKGEWDRDTVVIDGKARASGGK